MLLQAEVAGSKAGIRELLKEIDMLQVIHLSESIAKYIWLHGWVLAWVCSTYLTVYIG